MLIELDKMNDLAKEYGLFVNEVCYNSLDIFIDKLVEMNKVMNLTGITDPFGISEKHILDSLAVFKFIDFPENSSVIDVGTGAGFPGVPMGFYREDLQVTLLDSLMKRVKFLRESLSDGHQNFHYIHARAEDGGRDKDMREAFDFAIARAVAPMSVLSEYCMPFVKVGGGFIALKGPNENISAANEAVKKLGGEISEFIEYRLPSGDGRVLVYVKKISQISPIYPRNGGQIAKKPL